MQTDEKECPNCAESVKAAAKTCRFCGYDFVVGSVATTAQPAEKKKRSLGKTLGCFGSVAVFLLVFSCVAKVSEPGSMLASSPIGADTQLQNIKNKVAEDAVKQYTIAQGSGTPIDICVQAGMVSAAYLQAQDKQNYDRWKATEKRDCAAAGLQ